MFINSIKSDVDLENYVSRMLVIVDCHASYGRPFVRGDSLMNVGFCLASRMPIVPERFSVLALAVWKCGKKLCGYEQEL